MNRREFLYAAAASALLTRHTAFASETDIDLKAIAREAYLYTLPLIEMEATRVQFLARGPSENAIYGQRRLSDHTSRSVTSPNNDTLYATAWLDLAQGPVTITLPDLGKRYFSLQLMDFYSNSFAVLGTRTTGSGAATFTLIGPADASTPSQTNVVRAPTSKVWALARTLVDGPDDLAATLAVQNGVTIAGPKTDPGKIEPAAAKEWPMNAPWQAYFTEANRLLAAQRPPATDLAVMRRIAPLGLGPSFAPTQFGTAEQAAIEAGIKEARAIVIDPTFRGVAVDGWYYPGASLGNFGQDYIARAIVARTGLAASTTGTRPGASTSTPAGCRRSARSGR